MWGGGCWVKGLGGVLGEWGRGGEGGRDLAGVGGGVGGEGVGVMAVEGRDGMLGFSVLSGGGFSLFSMGLERSNGWDGLWVRARF